MKEGIYSYCHLHIGGGLNVNVHASSMLMLPNTAHNYKLSFKMSKDTALLAIKNI